MGTYGFDRFEDEVKLRLGQRTDFSTPTDWVGRWVNQAYIRLTSGNRLFGLRKNFYFPELEAKSSVLSTVDGTAYVTTPTDTLIVRSVWDSTSDRSLKNIGWDTYLEGTGRADTSAEGPPTAWVRSGSYIYLRPTPDAVYSLYAYYRKRPALLTGTTASAIGPEWDDVIVLMAVCQGFSVMGDYEHLKQAKEDLAERVAELIGIYEQEGKGKKEFMQIDPSYGSNGASGYGG